MFVTLILCATCVSGIAMESTAFNALTAWGIPQDSADSSAILHEDGTSEQTGDVTVTIEQTAYDGVTAYVFYTLKDASATAPLGELDADSGLYLLTDDAYGYFEKKNVGWFRDSIYVNGKEYSMPLAGGQEYGSTENGEMRCFLSIQLDSAGIEPTDSMTLGLPIGNPQGENKGILTATLDSSVKTQMEEKIFPQSVALGDITAGDVKTIITPVKLYITVPLTADSDAMIIQREKEQHEFDDAGIDMIINDDWAAVSLNSNWTSRVSPVNAEGEIIKSMMNGFTGAYGTGAQEAMFEFLLPPDDQEVYLAECGEDGKAIDMQKAVRIL